MEICVIGSGSGGMRAVRGKPPLHHDSAGVHDMSSRKNESYAYMSQS